MSEKRTKIMQVLIFLLGISNSVLIFAVTNDGKSNENLTSIETSNQHNLLRKKNEIEFFNLLITKDDWSKKVREQMMLDLANQGFQPAKFYTGYLAAKASGDLQKISSITTQILNSHDPTVECLVATHLHLLNTTTETNEKVLKDYITRSAEHGVAHCVYWSAAFKTEQPARFALILKAAKEGDLLAQHEIYKRYRDGNEVIKDLDQSFCWALKAEKSAKKVWSNSLENAVKEARFLYMKEYKKDPLQRNDSSFCKD